MVQSSKARRLFSAGGGGHRQRRFVRGLPTARFASILSPVAQRKLAAIRVAQTAGVAVPATAFNVHRSTIYRWLATNHIG